MMKALYKFFYNFLGWKIQGDFPHHLPKYIIVVAPHTSNWDFMVGLCVRSITGLRSNYIAKKELFRPPFGSLFRRLGGHPVERSSSTNFVDQVSKIFEEEEHFVIAITPEGTRKYSPDWKTGFYYIAKKVGIPIVPVGIDYETKTTVIYEPMEVLDTAESTIKYLKDVLGKHQGKNPEDGLRNN